MEDSVPEYLSAEELRNRLYHTLRNRGLVDNIKSQLRNSLVTELQQSIHGPLSLKDLKVPEEGSLLHRVTNSLIANHLRACGYEYSLSVFMPECGMNQDKKFATCDFIKLLNLSPHSRLHKRLSAETSPEAKKGFFWHLLSEISSLHANSSSTISCQTDLIKVGPITPLDEKLSDVDKFYTSQRDEFLRSGRASAEERLLSFQHQLEDRYNTQLKMEIARMRDAEIATIRIEEKENSRKALEQTKRELEHIYRDRHEALVQRERNAMERLQQQTDMQGRETYAQRQTILEEIEAVRQREVEVKREAEVNKREKKLAEDRVKDKENNLRRRELEIQQKETSFEQRLQNEIAQFKLDQQVRYIERIQNVEVREATVKEEERVVTEEKARLQSIKDELRDKTHRVNELETFLSEARHKEVNATKNNEYLNAKLRDMSDYSTLKEQVILYRNELETVRTRLAEVLSMNERERGRQEELLRELRRPSPESLMLQRDLERAKENLRQEQVMFAHQKQSLEARLKEELDRNKDIIHRFEEQTLQMKDMNREVVDLRQHLHMTSKALNNEVYRHPKDGENGPGWNDSRRSEGGNNASRHYVAFNLPVDDGPPKSRSFEYDDKDIYHDVDFPSMSNRGAGDYRDEDTSSLDSADIIAQAKYRLKSLDKEAHNLERAYSDFHHRVTNVNALSLDVPSETPSRKNMETRKMTECGIAEESLRQSPILFENPMSSTPYKQPRKPSQELEDSFAELGTQFKKQRSNPVLDLSAVRDDGNYQLQSRAERREKMRSITLDDLEQRPGSPGVVVMAGSASNSDQATNYDKKAETETGPPAPSVLLLGHQGDQPVQSIPAPQAPVSDQFSLDMAWKRQLEAETKTEQETARRQREMEEELRKCEEQQKEPEQLEHERERQNEEVRRAEQEKLEEAKEEDKIDPVMKQYMAMIQQQKEKEREETSKKTVGAASCGASIDRTPTHSEDDDLSVAGDDKSEQDGDDGFSW